MNISFMEFYNGKGIKSIVDKINGGSKNSRMSLADVAMVNSVLNVSGKSQIKNFCITTPKGKCTENSAQQAFVDLTKQICEEDNNYEMLKSLNWFYSDTDLGNVSNILRRYGKVREKSYIYKDAEVTLLMARSVKIMIDCGQMNALDNYSFMYEVKDEPVVQQKQPDTSDEWLPRIEDYHPGITKEQWLELLNNKDVFQEKHLLAMACLYDNGGEGSCSGLEEKYHYTMTLWRTTCGAHLAEKVAAVTDCDRLVENGKTAFFVILFLYRKAKGDEKGSIAYKLRPELYDALTEFDILRYLKYGKEEGGEEVTTTNAKDALTHIKNYIFARGFDYPDGLIENFYLSLKSKPFVILAGTSGTGKTRLVKLFAEAIGAAFKLVSVRPDWSDGSDLFGHTDLNGNFIPGPVCAAFDAAIREPKKPVFLCLDEMNLARVEYYLSDFLSVIESREKANGHIVTESIAQYEQGIPENLYIIGTVNMDETTFPFSKKVLDRANTIEFSYVDLMPKERSGEALAPQNLPNSFLCNEYLVLASDCADYKELVDKICTELQALNGKLVKANAHVGFRVRDEIVFYMLNNEKAGKLLSYEQAMDNEIMQKILPRIQGSSTAIKTLLIDMFKFCMGSGAGIDADNGNVGEQMKNAAASAKYPESAKKIGYMMTRFEDDGFTSYWL